MNYITLPGNCDIIHNLRALREKRLKAGRGRAENKTRVAPNARRLLNMLNIIPIICHIYGWIRRALCALDLFPREASRGSRSSARV